jgi:DNA-binding transcriptional regulator GbsR (MarR family)
MSKSQRGGKVAETKERPNSAKKAKSLPPEVQQLEEIAGRFIEYWGFKRVHGRIWAHLYISNHPLDSRELMARLGISKGMMSIAMRDLLEHEVILETHVGKHGSLYYAANPDLMSVISRVLRTREARMLGLAQVASESILRLKATQLEELDISTQRVQSVLNLTQSAQTLLSLFFTKGENVSSETAEREGALFSALFGH